MGILENAPKLEATDLPDTPLMKDYLDQYDSISNKLHDTKSFHDNRNVSTTYLGPGQQNGTDGFQPELSIPMNVNSHTQGRVLGGNRIDMLLDTGASKFYMSKAYYMKNPTLHTLPKYDTHIKCLHVGNGNRVATLFVVPIIVSIRDHRFEIFTLVISKNSTVWQLQQQLQWLHVTGCRVHLLLQMKLLAITI